MIFPHCQKSHLIVQTFDQPAYIYGKLDKTLKKSLS